MTFEARKHAVFLGLHRRNRMSEQGQRRKITGTLRALIMPTAGRPIAGQLLYRPQMRIK
jgi:hypothetical protein